MLNIFFISGYDCVISRISPILIEQYFDSSIVTKEDGKQAFKYTALGNKTKSITYDYAIDFTAILPPRETAPTNLYAPEMLVFYEMAKNPEYHKLLCHPFALVFTAIKWHKLRYFFYFDSFVDTVFTTVLIAYLLNYKYFTFYLVISTLFGLLVIWELVQMCTFGRGYFYFLDNVWNLFLIVITSTVVCFPHYLEGHEIITMQLFSAVALVSVLNLFLTLGNYPNSGTSVMMIRNVYFSLFKALFTYIVLIMAFSICMHILFKTNREVYFNNLALSIFRTITMSTGDLALESLELPSKPFGYFVVVLFIFFIPIGLFNLLTGIAVSDIQEIRSNSQLLSQQIRVDQVAKVEKIFVKPKMLKYFSYFKCLCLFSVSDKDCKVLIDVDTRIITVKGRYETMKLAKHVNRTLRSRMKRENE